MGTVIRPELSKRNKYWISKHRYYELKHFCLQYKEWKDTYKELSDSCISPSLQDKLGAIEWSDRTSNVVFERDYYRSKMDLIERTAYLADKDIGWYILKAVTEGKSYTYLSTVLDIPCSRGMYYDRYRKFFWLLSFQKLHVPL